MKLHPTTPAEVVEAVRSTPRLLAVGAGTKPRLSAIFTPKLSTARLSGIVEYDPDEFTFTALAGTPVREIQAALAARGQHLPFDPMLVQAGSTLGGAVASGLSGPGRFRFGGIRDFILGVRFVDGMGRLLRMGGKVVKNAAGFDLPKFLTGSLGRFGVLVELTFKVFPRPPLRTVKLTLENTEEAVKVLTGAAGTRWEVDALDLLPDGRTVLMRVPAADAVPREVLTKWPGVLLGEEEAAAMWQDLREFRWADAGEPLIKVPVTPNRVAALLKETQAHVSAGGNVAYVPGRQMLSLPGLTLRGDGPLWHGPRATDQISRAVKAALDPGGRFPSLEDS